MMAGFLLAVFYVVAGVNKPHVGVPATFANYPWDLQFAIVIGIMLGLGGVLGFGRSGLRSGDMVLFAILLALAVLGSAGIVIFGILRHDTVETTLARALNAIRSSITFLIGFGITVALVTKLSGYHNTRKKQRLKNGGS